MAHHGNLDIGEGRDVVVERLERIGMEIDEVTGDLDRDELPVALVVVDGAAHVAADQVEAHIKGCVVAADGRAPAIGADFGNRRIEAGTLGVVEGRLSGSQEEIGYHRGPPASVATGRAASGRSADRPALRLSGWITADNRASTTRVPPTGR